MFANRFTKQFVAIVVILLPCLSNAEQEHVVTTNLCALASNPAEFDHKLVKLTGDVTHGYRVFTLSDACKPNLSSIWLEYGGLINAPSIYDSGHMHEPRSQPLVVDGISTTLIDDASFRKFDKLVTSMSDKPQARVTLIGRYFAGHQQQVGEIKIWKGFGPLGCCTLLVIQQVVDVKNSKQN